MVCLGPSVWVALARIAVAGCRQGRRRYLAASDYRYHFGLGRGRCGI